MVWSKVQAAIEAAKGVLPREGHPLRPVCLMAVAAAEGCELHRTPEAAWAAALAIEAVEKADSAAPSSAEEAALRAAWWAAQAACWAAEGRKEAAEDAASAATETAEEARRLLAAV